MLLTRPLPSPTCACVRVRMYVCLHVTPHFSHTQVDALMNGIIAGESGAPGGDAAAQGEGGTLSSSRGETGGVVLGLGDDADSRR